MSETLRKKSAGTPGEYNKRRTGKGKIPHRKPAVSEKQVSYNMGGSYLNTELKNVGNDFMSAGWSLPRRKRILRIPAAMTSSGSIPSGYV